MEGNTPPYYTSHMLWLCLGLSAEIKATMMTLDKAVTTKEGRFMSRAIRMVTTLRRLLKKPVLSKAIETYVPADSPVRYVCAANVDFLASCWYLFEFVFKRF